MSQDEAPSPGDALAPSFLSSRAGSLRGLKGSQCWWGRSWRRSCRLAGAWPVLPWLMGTPAPRTSQGPTFPWDSQPARAGRAALWASRVSSTSSLNSVISRVGPVVSTASHEVPCPDAASTCPHSHSPTPGHTVLPAPSLLHLTLVLGLVDLGVRGRCWWEPSQVPVSCSLS